MRWRDSCSKAFALRAGSGRKPDAWKNPEKVAQ
jgi:hypothetical protein